jgi:transcriptional regulator with XRE-family HTH domain
MAKPRSPAATPRQGRLPRTDRDRRVDAYVGSRVRLKRTIQGLSQTELGTAVGVTFQQMQKYESGANRVSASKLWALSEVLDVPISYFFDGLESDSSTASPGEAIAADRYATELMRAVARIHDPKLRDCLLGLVKVMAED